jgi:amidase
MFVADGGKSVDALLSVTGEPYRPEMVQYKDAKELGVYDMWKLHTERSELQRQYLEQWMSIEGLDAILGELGTVIRSRTASNISQHLRPHTQA